MPRKRVVTREIDITIATCLFVNPGKKEQKKLKLKFAGSYNQRQIDRKKPIAKDRKLIFVKCLSVKLARGRYEMPINEFIEKAKEIEVFNYGEEKEKTN